MVDVMVVLLVEHQLGRQINEAHFDIVDDRLAMGVELLPAHIYSKEGE